jgi:hypothetical protein
MISILIAARPNEVIKASQHVSLPSGGPDGLIRIWRDPKIARARCVRLLRRGGGRMPEDHASAFPNLEAVPVLAALRKQHVRLRYRRFIRETGQHLDGRDMAIA